MLRLYRMDRNHAVNGSRLKRGQNGSARTRKDEPETEVYQAQEMTRKVQRHINKEMG